MGEANSEYINYKITSDTHKGLKVFTIPSLMPA